MAGERSPNYPIISLPDAVSRIQTIYERERTHPADKDVVAKALGFGSLNGASRGVISALRKYGLLAEEGDQVKVSHDALDVLLRSAGTPERVSALSRAAFSPPLFSELRGAFGTSLPSDENMRAYLIKKGFNPNTVSNVIRSYRDTVAMVNAESASPEAEALEAPHEEVTARPTVKTITMIPPETPTTTDRVLAFQLTEDCHAAIALKGNVTQEALHKLKAFIDLSMDAFPHHVERPGASELEDLGTDEEAGIAAP